LQLGVRGCGGSYGLRSRRGEGLDGGSRLIISIFEALCLLHSMKC
jgi:hypothetical protein